MNQPFSGFPTCWEHHQELGMVLINKFVYMKCQYFFLYRSICFPIYKSTYFSCINLFTFLLFLEVAGHPHEAWRPKAPERERTGAIMEKGPVGGLHMAVPTCPKQIFSDHLGHYSQPQRSFGGTSTFLNFGLSPAWCHLSFSSAFWHLAFHQG